MNGRKRQNATTAVWERLKKHKNKTRRPRGSWETWKDLLSVLLNDRQKKENRIKYHTHTKQLTDRSEWLVDAEINKQKKNEMDTIELWLLLSAHVHVLAPIFKCWTLLSDWLIGIKMEIYRLAFVCSLSFWFFLLSPFFFSVFFPACFIEHILFVDRMIIIEKTYGSYSFTQKVNISQQVVTCRVCRIKESLTLKPIVHVTKKHSFTSYYRQISLENQIAKPVQQDHSYQ